MKSYSEGQLAILRYFRRSQYTMLFFGEIKTEVPEATTEDLQGLVHGGILIRSLPDSHEPAYRLRTK